MHFADRLFKHIQQKSPIMLGIDPDFDLIPDVLLPQSSDAHHVSKSLFDFSKIVIDCTAPYICGVKFQSAYFEQQGSAGINALAKAIAYAKSLQIPVVLDGKRGDIGSSSTAYATAFLKGHTQLRNNQILYSDFESDALTVAPYMGDDSLSPFVEAATQHNKGLFVLVKTSNAGSATLQDLDTPTGPLFYQTAKLVHGYTQNNPLGLCGFSHIGAVVGATHPDILLSLRQQMPKALFLMPGVGAQGSSIDSLKKSLHGDLTGIIIPISRGITHVNDLSCSLETYQDRVKQNLELFYNRIELV